MSVHDSLKGGYFFFYLPLRAQLTNLFESNNLSHLLCKRDSVNSGCGSFRDITDGNLYKSLQFACSPSSYDLTLMFNCDGVPVFKYSSFSIWPVLCVINELPPGNRSDHILMNALWFGAGKPEMSVFLEPFVEECQNLRMTVLLLSAPIRGALVVVPQQLFLVFAML